MKIETAFAANYEVNIPSDLPSDGKGVLYFPPRESGNQHLYETAIKFVRAGQVPWYGVFAARSKRGEGLTLVSTLPDPDSCFVSVLGTGYVLNVQRPLDWATLAIYPVTQNLVVSDPELLVLSCFTRMTAYGAEGQKWTTARLCSDQLKVLGIKETWIECSGWNADTGQEVHLRVDISSGKLAR